MRALMLALLLVGPASAEAPQAADTVSFTRAELQSMLDELEEMVKTREAAAFQAGKRDATDRCRNIL
jgi:hypothetical protein